MSNHSDLVTKSVLAEALRGPWKFGPQNHKQVPFSTFQTHQQPIILGRHQKATISTHEQKKSLIQDSFQLPPQSDQQTTKVVRKTITSSEKNEQLFKMVKTPNLMAKRGKALQLSSKDSLVQNHCKQGQIQNVEQQSKASMINERIPSTASYQLNGQIPAQISSYNSKLAHFITSPCPNRVKKHNNYYLANIRETQQYQLLRDRSKEIIRDYSSSSPNRDLDNITATQPKQHPNVKKIHFLLELRKAQRLITIEQKLQLAQHYKEQYGIIVRDADILGMSESELLIKLERRKMRKEEQEAVVRLQAWVRMHFVRQAYLKLSQLRLYAVLMVQRKFRDYRRHTIVPRMLKQRRDNAASTVQKYMRGYLVNKEWTLLKKKKRIESNYVHFAEWREQVVHDCQVKIVKQWREYRANRSVRLARLQRVFEEQQRLKKEEEERLRIQAEDRARMDLIAKKKRPAKKGKQNVKKQNSKINFGQKKASVTSPPQIGGARKGSISVPQSMAASMLTSGKQTPTKNDKASFPVSPKTNDVKVPPKTEHKQRPSLLHSGNKSSLQADDIKSPSNTLGISRQNSVLHSEQTSRQNGGDSDDDQSQRIDSSSDSSGEFSRRNSMYNNKDLELFKQDSAASAQQEQLEMYESPTGPNAGTGAYEISQIKEEHIEDEEDNIAQTFKKRLSIIQRQNSKNLGMRKMLTNKNAKSKME
ncbi:hypothetical protein FGO68_gene233 [Halteria grandinella]|uniref:Uncharacterized protein n=1 Tax=Halteria grandinella TaxID=5974 RepID=A0A8J8NXP8_HALGN|nr:hypothetical protein FGO68_gene233 [Halteria grandinella]